MERISDKDVEELKKILFLKGDLICLRLSII
jgi:hypothetical protein